MYKVQDDSQEHTVSSYDSINDSDDQTESWGDSKFCSEFGSGELVNLGSLRSRIKKPEFVCNSCGRSASDKSILCWPENL